MTLPYSDGREFPEVFGDPFPEDNQLSRRGMYQRVHVVHAAIHDPSRPYDTLADGPSRSARCPDPPGNGWGVQVPNPGQYGYTTIRWRAIPDNRGPVFGGDLGHLDRRPALVRVGLLNLPRMMADWLMFHIRAYAMTERRSMTEVSEVAHVGLTVWWRQLGGDPYRMELPRLRVSGVSVGKDVGHLFGILCAMPALHEDGAPRMYTMAGLGPGEPLPPGL